MKRAASENPIDAPPLKRVKSTPPRSSLILFHLIGTPMPKVRKALRLDDAPQHDALVHDVYSYVAGSAAPELDLERTLDDLLGSYDPWNDNIEGLNEVPMRLIFDYLLDDYERAPEYLPLALAEAPRSALGKWKSVHEDDDGCFIFKPKDGVTIDATYYIYYDPLIAEQEKRDDAKVARSEDEEEDD